MKTYKLIQTYPSSFSLGHLAVLDQSEKYYNLGTTTRSLDYIEKHPEHWQHVCYKCHENVNTCKTFGCKQAIFITEDGVDIFKDDFFFYINSLWLVCRYKATTLEPLITHPLFSTKKAAENYIKMNKPCLSLKEVFDTMGNLLETREEFKAKLTKIVKQKLK